MATEQSPLIVDSATHYDDREVQAAAVIDHDKIYDRFSARRKSTILFLVAWSGLAGPFVSGSIMPVIPLIVRDLGSTGSIVSLTISISVLASAIGSVIGASYATFYGRRPVYLVGLPLLFIGSFGVALSPDIYSLFFWRVIQALGSSPGVSVGAGVIGDIYRLEERGTAMGIYFSGILLGPALAPFISGVAAYYYSWRTIQTGIGITAAAAYLAIFFILPETSHPGKRGIDQWRADRPPGTKFRFVWVNPLGCVALLKSPHLLLLSLAGATALLTDYVLVSPLAYTIAPAYGLTNPALIGLCYVPIGTGNFVGAPLAGWISDKLVVRYRALRGNVWYPEDRLRGTLLGAGLFVPMTVLGSGLLTQYAPSPTGKLSWSLGCNLVLLFFNGIGVDFVLSPSASYGVDIMHARSSETMAINASLRGTLIALGVAVLHPLITHLGIAATNGIAAVLAWIGFGMLCYLIKYGDELREWSSVEYSTAGDN